MQKRTRVFLSDLDGTLLDDDKKIGARTRAALEAFIADGNCFAIATGRAMDSAMAVQRTLGLNDPRTYLVAYNGAQIYDCDRQETIYRIGIDLSLIPPIFALARRHRVHIHTYNDREIISPTAADGGDLECLEYYRRAILSPLVLTEDVMAHLPAPPCKCLAIELHDREKLERFRRDMADLVGPDITLLYSNPQYLEIFRSEAGKGAALTRLCDYLGIPTACSIAAGDEENDISMLRAAGLGIAMKNGTERARAAADVVTREDNCHDGLAPFLEEAVYRA